MRAMLALAYNFGFRKAELLTLKVSDVDILDGVIRLRTSKNGGAAPSEPNRRDAQAAVCISGKNEGESVLPVQSFPASACLSLTFGEPGKRSQRPQSVRGCCSRICAALQSGT
jgi:hypothetical protein